MAMDATIAAAGNKSEARAVHYVLYFAVMAIGFFGIIDFILNNVPLPDSSKGHLIAKLLSGWKEGLLIVLFVCIYMIAKQRGQKLVWHSTRLHWGILLALVGALLSAVVNFVRPDIAYYGVKVLLESTLYFIALVVVLEEEDTIRQLINAMLITITALSLYGLYQYASGMTSPSSWVYASHEADIKLRVFSSIGNPNDLGGLMVLFAPIAIALAYAAKTTKMRIVYIAMAAIMAFCLLHTYSRGAWGGFVVAIIVYALATRNKPLLFVLVIGGILAAIFFRHSKAVGRLTLVFTKTYWQKSQDNGRAEFWGRALRIWLQHPIFGKGIGMVGDTVAIVHKVPGATWIDNQYIKVIAEQGIVGLGTYLYMLMIPIVSGWRYVLGQTGERDARRNYLTAVAAGSMAAIAGMVAENATAGIFETTIDSTYFWALCGILYATIRIGAKRAQAEQSGSAV